MTVYQIHARNAEAPPQPDMQWWADALTQRAWTIPTRLAGEKSMGLREAIRKTLRLAAKVAHQDPPVRYWIRRAGKWELIRNANG